MNGRVFIFFVLCAPVVSACPQLSRECFQYSSNARSDVPPSNDWMTYCLARVRVDAQFHASCSGGEAREWDEHFRRLASCENAPPEIADGYAEFNSENARRVLLELSGRQCADSARVVLEQLTIPINAPRIGDKCGLECPEGPCRLCENGAYCPFRGAMADTCVARISAGRACDDLGIPCVFGAHCSAGRCQLGPGLRCSRDDECESSNCDQGRCQRVDSSPNQCGPEELTAIGLPCDELACLGPGLGSECQGACRDPHLFCDGEGVCRVRPVRGMECTGASLVQGADPCYRSICIDGLCRDAPGE